ncbi:hypothetical protein NFI96_020067 [Prochilodus magdalenae]|nr:hypothetical protein NFI96_020067 [Prochilodus magdalenae]
MGRSSVVTDEDTVKRYYAKFEEKFFQTCEKELAKINTFYSEKLAEAQRRFATLQNELQSSLDAQRESSRAPGLRRRRAVFHLSQQERCKHRNIKDLQLAFSEFYLSLILLQNYQNLNFTGFRKILKKHDKIFETARGADWRVAHVEVAPFYTCKKITQLISETEALVTTELEGGDRQKAMKRLRVPPLGAAQGTLSSVGNAQRPGSAAGLRRERSVAGLSGRAQRPGSVGNARWPGSAAGLRRERSVAGLSGRAQWPGSVAGLSGRAQWPGSVAGLSGRAQWPGSVAGLSGRAQWPGSVAGLSGRAPYQHWLPVRAVSELVLSGKHHYSGCHLYMWETGVRIPVWVTMLSYTNKSPWPAPAWTTFRVGLYCGVFIVLLVTITITGVVCLLSPDTPGTSSVWPLVRIYRGGFLLIEFLFLLGINTYGWRQAGVNHVLIFELNPRNNLSHQHLFEIAGFLGVLWCVSILSCLFSKSLMIPIQASPLALYGFFLIFLINPFKTCYYKSRFWLLKLLDLNRNADSSFCPPLSFTWPPPPALQFRVVTAPFHRVEFADFWLADQLNSLAVLLMDLEYLVCFYSVELDWTKSYQELHFKNSMGMCNTYSYGVRAVIQCLPAWFRFVQCLRRYRDTKRAFPHLVNAGKYSTTFFVVTFSALYKTHKAGGGTEKDIFFYMLIAFSVINSCYTLVWDLKMDWGLFDRNAGENTLLREEIVYPQKAYYYCAILEDVILRFAWTIPLSVGAVTSCCHIGDVLATVLAPLEVFRRFVWNFFRLENEHLNNCGEFRAVRDISVAPMNADDQTLLEQMMDQEDGVRNRQGKKSWKRSYSMSLRRPRLASQSKMRDTKVLIEDTDDDT